MSVCDAKMIKSAQRALQVLEFFDSEHPHATVMEISRQLGYPQSSTSELLRCLVSLGYLEYDRYKRVYEPTARVPLLGAWVQPGLFRRGRLLPMLDAIARATGLTVTLSTVVSLDVQCIHVIKGKCDLPLELTAGSTRSLLHSSNGRLFMSRYLEKRVRAILHRLNADEPNSGKHVKFENLCNEMKVIRQQGYAAEFGEFEAGYGAIHMLLTHSDGQMLAVGVGGLANAIQANADELIGTMRTIMRPQPIPANLDLPRMVPPVPVETERRYALA